MEQKLAQLQAKLEADGSLGEKLFALETPEEVQSLLKGQGIEFSLEEIDMLRKVLVKTAEKGELTDEDLEEVAGGIVISTILAVAAVTASAGGFINSITRGRW